MEEITDLSLKSLDKYFTALSHSGYKSYSEVYKLLALIGMEEMLDIFAGLITELDFKRIHEAISCLSGTTCLVNFPSYTEKLSIIHKGEVNFLTRISEEEYIRVSDDMMRILE